ncbi:MAG: [Lachnospiraceae bacterium]|nr:[FeFe] hydrogenase H-cluster maturation GTPase HydF [Lachnospiraceae bacterium]
MSLNETPMAERVQIGFFGLRNAGKSSLVNRITSQQMSLVSNIKGTTTDPVKKSMELLPLGPVTITDTPGFDDEGELGRLRAQRTEEVLKSCDIAVLVTENRILEESERELLERIGEKGIPCVIALNKCDINGTDNAADPDLPYITVRVSALTGEGTERLKQAIASLDPGEDKKHKFVADLIKPGDKVVLVIPIDESAPKGRLILPQQMAIRDILDAGGVSLVCGVKELGDTLSSMKKEPSLVITDSQAFAGVAQIVPDNIPLTSFSILMARYKGFLNEAVRSAEKIDSLEAGAKILISEGCTHHRQCGDIGTVKLPKLLYRYTGKEFKLSFTSGHGFSEDLGEYELVIHCGGCMLSEKEMRGRMLSAGAAGVAFTNYGIAMAHMNGILKRCTEEVPGLL